MSIPQSTNARYICRSITIPSSTEKSAHPRSKCPRRRCCQREWCALLQARLITMNQDTLSNASTLICSASLHRPCLVGLTDLNPTISKAG